MTVYIIVLAYGDCEFSGYTEVKGVYLDRAKAEEEVEYLTESIPVDFPVFAKDYSYEIIEKEIIE